MNGSWCLEADPPVLLCFVLFCFYHQGGVSDDVSLTAYITAAMLELDANVTVSLASFPLSAVRFPLTGSTFICTGTGMTWR